MPDRPQIAWAGHGRPPRGITVDFVSTVPSFPPAPVRTRDLPVPGVPLWRLRGPEWERVSHGLHAPAVFERSVPELARLTAPVLPRDSGFGHLTSARLRGWWLPNELGDHVLLATTRSGVHVQRQGLYVRRSHYAEAAPVDGLPLMTAAQTLVELARDLTLVDLVPMVDCALAAGASPEEILAAARPGARGAGTLRRAVGLADPRSESWWESVSGWCTSWRAWGRWSARLTLPAGTESSPGPTSTWSARVGTRSATAGSIALARTWPISGGTRRCTERCRALRLHHERDRSEPHVVIEDAETARGYPHDPRRVARWWAVARGSSLTAYGRTRLAGRLRRYRLAAER